MGSPYNGAFLVIEGDYIPNDLPVGESQDKYAILDTGEKYILVFWEKKN